jgi:hypothetical protein
MRLLDVIAFRIGHRGVRMRGRLWFRLLWRICVTEKPPTRL